MDVRFPLRVAMMDDDYFALKGVASLLSRDLRTVVVAECDSAEMLINYLDTVKRHPDIILIDAEYRQAAIPLDILLQRTRKLSPESMLMCWSQYGDPELMRAAVAAGTDAILIKKEVRLAIATHLVRAFRAKRAYTPSVVNILGDAFNEWVLTAARLEPWQPHPDLSPRLKQVFWLCMVYGMSVKATAAEMHVQPETIERYRMKIYDILGDGWVSDANVLGALEEHASEPGSTPRGVEWAFYQLTQPPRHDDNGS